MFKNTGFKFENIGEITPSKMKQAIALLLVLILSIATTFAQGEKETASLYEHLLKDFKESKIREDGSKLLVFQSYTVLYHDFDVSILEKLEELYPKELKEALSSSGNMHNPKMVSLRKPFEDSLLSIAIIVKLVENLKEQGYEIVKVSHEKLSIDKSNESPRVKVAGWFICKPIKVEPSHRSYSGA